MQPKKVILILVVLFLSFTIFQTYTMFTLTGRTTTGTGTVGLCTITAPNIISIPSQTATVGRVFSYAVNCTSDCGESLSITHHTVPSLSSFAINSSNGEINFTPQDGEDDSYTVYIYCDKPETAFGTDDTSFALTISAEHGPSHLDGNLTGNHSVYLNWTNVTSADNFTLYYSSNISAIMALDLDNLPSNFTKVEDLTGLNWTDLNASQDQKRYYTVSATKGGVESLTQDTPVGKFTYYYTAPSSDVYGTLASNRIALYLNLSYTAEPFLQEIPSSLNPTISKLEKTNASGEYLTTHVQGLADGNDFDMEISEGYQLTVDADHNHTLVGKVYNSPYILEYQAPVSSEYGTLATNWKGLFDFNKTHTAEDFLQEIPANLNPTISKLEKTNASGEFLTTHVRGLADGNDFDMEIGVGYAITVDADHNHTLCTNCFGYT